MDNYKIINNEDLLKDFIKWLPDLQINERFYVGLFSRRKYCEGIKYVKTDKAQCARFISKKEDLFKKIKQLEIPFGYYDVKGVMSPQESLALYITINPRDLKDATHNTLIKFAQMTKLQYNGYNPLVETMSEIHKSCSRKLWYDFDFDGVNYETIISKIDGFINNNAITVVKTRGGFHLLVNLNKIEYKYRNTWWKNITSLEGCDVRGDVLLPVIGCTQGGFTPHFIRQGDR